MNIDTESLKDWIRDSVDKMLAIAEAEARLKTLSASLKEVNQDLEEESNHKAGLTLLKDKLLVKKYEILKLPESTQDSEALFEIDQQMEQNDLQIETIAQGIEGLTEKSDYLNSQVSRTKRDIMEINTEFMG